MSSIVRVGAGVERRRVGTLVVARCACTLGSLPMQIIILGQNLSIILVIADKSARRRESDLLDAFAPQILRCAQDDTTPPCHPERSEGSRVEQ